MALPLDFQPDRQFVRVRSLVTSAQLAQRQTTCISKYTHGAVLQ
jgi:hypothetical protein